jgi:transglutaminase-like putative cysteine protease
VIYDLSHRTTFSYAQPVSISHHVLHLMPRSGPGQTCERAAIIVDPAPTVRSDSHDYFGNPVTHLTVQEPHDRLLVHASARIDVGPRPPIAAQLSPPWEAVIRALAGARDEATLDAYQFAFDSPYITVDDDVRAYALPSFTPDRPVLDAAIDLTARIFHEFTYEGGVTDVSTPVHEVLMQRRGVCQDFAHLQIACLRSLGLPARYVSGYLMTRPPEGQQKLVGADASHAWLSVWCPALGWVDFDPTNNLIPGDEHITLAWGRDYGDVSPINGMIIGGGSHEVAVAVDVVPAPQAA